MIATDNSIISSAITFDGKYLFVLDEDGFLIQFDIKRQKKIKHYGNVLLEGLIGNIAITFDNKYLFIEGSKCLKQFDIKQQKLIQSYEGMFIELNGLLAFTYDSQYLFIKDKFDLKQLDIKKQKFVKNYEFLKEHQETKAMAISNNSKYCFTLDHCGNLDQIDIENRDKFNKYGNTFPHEG